MKRFIQLALVFAVALVLLVFGVSFLFSRSTGSRVSAERAQIKADGDKVLFTEYATDPVPNDDNAFYYLMQLEPYSQGFEKSLVAIPEFEAADYEIVTGSELSPSLIASLEKIVDETEEGFLLVEKAANAKVFRSKIDHSLGFGAELKHGSIFRSAGRMLKTRAVVLASQGKGDEALQNCIDGLNLQRLVVSEPMIVQLLMAISVQDQMLGAAHHVLLSSETSSTKRAELARVLASIDNESELGAALKAERATGLLTFDQLREGTAESIGGSPLPSVLSSNWLGQAYLNDDEAEYIRIMNQSIALVGRPRNERKPIEDEIEAELSKGGFRKVVTRMLVPALTQIARAQEVADTKLRCLRVYLQLLEDGNADSIEGVVSIDPISRQPLIIKKQPEGWLVYGVGENEKDDGGDFDQDPTTFRTFDIGFGPTLKKSDVDSESP
ncbi:MAG: hypothetical protein AAFX06_01760 [Planctomycetota bacterium]